MRKHSSPGTSTLSFRAPLALLLVVVSASVSPLPATTLVHLSDADLVDAADLVIEGECLGSTSRWIEGELYTITRVRVDDALVGDPPGEVRIVIPGGIDPNAPVPVAVSIPGAPHLAPDERVVLFVDRIEPSGSFGDATFTIVGFSQGKHSVIETPSGPAVVRDLRGASLAAGQGLTRGGLEPAEPLEAFTARIRALADDAARPEEVER